MVHYELFLSIFALCRFGSVWFDSFRLMAGKRLRWRLSFLSYFVFYLRPSVVDVLVDGVFCFFLSILCYGFGNARFIGGERLGRFCESHGVRCRGQQQTVARAYLVPYLYCIFFAKKYTIHISISVLLWGGGSEDGVPGSIVLNSF